MKRIPMAMLLTAALVATIVCPALAKIPSPTPDKLTASHSQNPSPDGVPAALWQHFTRGVNITRWFCYTGQSNPIDHFKTYMLPQDFQNFKDLHLGFVRLCIGEPEMYRNGDYDQQNMPYVDRAVAQLIRNGQSVIWDLHDNSQIGLTKDPSTRPGLVTFWRHVAQHYIGQYEKSMVFEIKNEPVFQKDREAWYKLQEQVVQAIRSIDPSRTIMVTCTDWSSIDQLDHFTPLPQKNLIYTVHCYDPFLFTHQGASWVGNPPSGLVNMPFPADEARAQAILPLNEPANKDTILWYGKQPYNADYLLGRMQKAMDWAHDHHVAMVLGEFGQNPPKALPADRARWFDAMRAAFDRTGIPWCVWGYDDGMGLGREVVKGPSSDQVHLNQLVLQHLFKASLPSSGQ